MNTNPLLRLPKGLLISILLVLILLIAACDLGFNLTKPELDETDIANAVEETLAAESTRDAIEAPAEISATAPDTSLSPQPSETPAPTEIQVEPPTPVLSSPTLLPANLSEVPLSDFKQLYWVPLNLGCKNNDASCFKLFDDYKTLGGQAEAILTGQDEVHLEESWPSPHLVYWNKRNLKYQATINLYVDGQPITVKFVPKGEVAQWKEEYLDVGDYKGKTIRVQFICPVGMKYVSSWFLNDLRIVPDYNPK